MVHEVSIRLHSYPDADRIVFVSHAAVSYAVILDVNIYLTAARLDLTVSFCYLSGRSTSHYRSYKFLLDILDLLLHDLSDKTMLLFIIYYNTSCIHMTYNTFCIVY